MNLNLLPPWLRRLQQNPFISLILIPALIAAAPAFFKCAGDGFAHLSLGCFKIGGSMALAYVIALIQHSPNSASFMPDGSPNVAVAVAAQAAKVGEPAQVTTPTLNVVQPPVLNP